MKTTVPKLTDDAMIQMAKDYLTKRNVVIVDRDYQDTIWHVAVWHSADSDRWHQVRFEDQADKTLGWLVEVVWVRGDWQLTARSLPHA